MSKPEMFENLNDSEDSLFKLGFNILVDAAISFYNNSFSFNNDVFGKILYDITPREYYEQIENLPFNIISTFDEYIVKVQYLDNSGQIMYGDIIILDYNNGQSNVSIRYELIHYDIFVNSAMQLNSKFMNTFLVGIKDDFYESFVPEINIPYVKFKNELTRLKLKYS